MRAKIFFKSSWVYLAVFMCVELTLGNPLLFSEQSENQLKAEEQDNNIPHDWNNESGSGAALFRFSEGDALVGDGDNAPPKLIEKTEFSLIDLPVGYIQYRKIGLSFLVGEKGEVVDFKVSPFRGELPETMVESIKGWKFSPFIKNGKAVACIYDYRARVLPFRVTLQDVESASVPPIVRNPLEQCIFGFGDDEITGSITPWLLNSKIVRSRNPFYPKHAQGFHRFGKLLLSGIVDENGKLKKVKVESADYLEHRDAAEKIVKKWKFRPGMRDDGAFVPTKVWIDLIIYPPALKLINEEEGLIPPVVVKAYDLRGMIGNDLWAFQGDIRFGSVVLALTIDQNGIIEDIEVEHSDIARLNQHIRRAFLQWTFRPGFKDGKPVKTRSRYSVSYRSDHFLPSKGKSAH